MSTETTEDEAIEPSIDTSLEEGDWARDTGTEEDDDLLLIVDVLDEVACTHVILEEPNGTKHTVASHRSNRGKFDPRARVLMGVYKSNIDRKLEDEEPHWTAADVVGWYKDDRLGEYNLKAYPFPADRVDPKEVI